MIFGWCHEKDQKKAEEQLLIKGVLRDTLTTCNVQSWTWH